MADHDENSPETVAQPRPDPHEQSLFEAPVMAEQERMVEAILFASTEPVSVKELNDRMPMAAMRPRRWCICANATRGGA